MTIILNKNFQLISDEIALGLFGVFLSFILFIVLSFIEKNHFSKAYKIMTSIFGLIALVPVFVILLITNGNILALAAAVLFIAALVVHIKKLKPKQKT